jgi:hypothetical protein
MIRQTLATGGALAMALMVSIPAWGQSAATKPGAAKTAWTPPKTAGGQPDMEGIWTNATLTPLERPKELGDKKYFTEAEAAAFEKQVVQSRNADTRNADKEADVARAYNDAWWDWGSKIAKTRQTSLIMDPPDGKVPPYTPEAQRRIAANAQAIKERCEHTVCPPGNFGLAIPADVPEDRPPMERCIVWNTTGPPMLPTAYNNNYRIVQTPGYVTINIEMIHDFRVIPLDGRPHLPPNIHQWLGDSRGHWEGNTLVVDVTNFTDKTAFRNSTDKLHVVERFTRTDPNTLMYEFTVDDPATFVRPWTGSIPMSKTPGPLYEYACHEGNIGMTGILSGARSMEKERTKN